MYSLHVFVILRMTILVVAQQTLTSFTQQRTFEQPDVNITWAQQSNLTCYACSLDFRYSPWDGNNDCLGTNQPVTTVYLVACGIHELYCQENFVSQNGVLLTLARSCSSSCYSYCKSTGFGVTRSSCNYCCTSDGCNSDAPDLSVSVL